MKRFLIGLVLCLLSLPAHATISCSLPFTFVAGQVASAAQVMANYNALVTCFTQAASAGANSDITSLNGLTTPITPAQGGTNVFLGGTSTGSANIQVVNTTTPNTFTLTAGYRVSFIAGFTNTGATTLNVHSTGATNVFRYQPGGPVALTGGEIQASNVSEAIYDGTRFILLNPQTQFGGFNGATILASGATTDLGTIPSHFIQLTGAAAINSFGSTADVNFPIYYIRCNCTATLTYNATSMILPGTANITMAAGDFMVAEYLGAGNWRVLGYERANGTAIVNPTPLCGATGLTLSTNGTNANIVYAADSTVLINPTGNVPIFVANVSGTINTSNGTVTSAVDAMDGEATPTSVFGFVYLISNGTTTGGLVSTSATVPTMPSGYTYRCRIGAIRFSAASIPLVHHTFGRNTDYFPTAGGNTTTFPALQATGASFAGALTSLTAPPAGTSITSFVPSTAIRVKLIMACTTNCTWALSSSSATNGSTFSATNPSECQQQDAAAIGARICELPYNGGSVFFMAANAGTWGLAVMGWTDKVNAN